METRATHGTQTSRHLSHAGSMWRNYPVLVAAVAVLGQEKQAGRLGLPTTHCSPGQSVLGVVKLRLQVDRRNRHGMGVPDIHL